MKNLFLLICCLTLALFAVSVAQAGQESKEVIQARAMGTSTQLGHVVTVTIHIYEYSTQEDQQALVEAFKEGKSEGLFNALTKMPSVGRIAITGTLGYDVKYAREIPGPNGRKIRLITDRAVRFGETWRDTRSSDYNLTLVELDVNNEKKETTGTLIPAAMFTVDQEKQVATIEAYKNPWKLVDIKIEKKDK